MDTGESTGLRERKRGGGTRREDGYMMLPADAGTALDDPEPAPGWVGGQCGVSAGQPSLLGTGPFPVMSPGTEDHL